MCHAHTTDVCLEYFEKMRRQVYQTPKSYLSFIAAYQVMYKTKLVLTQCDFLQFLNLKLRRRRQRDAMPP